MIEQDRDLRNVHWFRPKVVNVVGQHLNQPRIVGQIRARAVREEGKPQGINCQMPFDAIRCLVEAESLGLHTSITGVLYRK